MNNQALLSAASRRWGIELSCLRPDLPLGGSPERSAWRRVVEAADGRLLVLEKIPSRVYARKRKIATVLQQLLDHGLKTLVTFLPDVDGQTISLINQDVWHGLWQLSPYVTGVDLIRPAYAMDGWRGEATAAFLIQIDEIGNTHPLAANEEPFSIVDYCRTLFAILEDRHPETAAQYHPFMDHLENHFFPVHDRLSAGFCHGDLHPLNIIWGDTDIRAVIDWEFCGVKPEIYDLANLLGCLGMEDPQSLTGPFAGALIRRLREAGTYSDRSWQALPDLMLAVRFAWLSEWMRKKDRPMIRLEADYMTMLLGKQARLIHPAICD